MAVIPGLPIELATVPEAPYSSRDPWANEKRAEFRLWVPRVEEYRALKRFECSEEFPHFEDMRRIEMAKCAQSRSYFTAVWCDIYEPRKRARKLGLGGSFIPFERQVELFDAIEECLTVEDGGPLADMAVPKCRDIGASWCFCAAALHDWIFLPESQVRLISYKKDFVDAKSPDSLFWKIDFMRDRLPDWMLPRFERNYMYLTNLENGNLISGEATTQRSGRAGRSSWMLFDEASFFDEFVSIWIGSAAAAESRFAVSSIYLETGPDFYRLSMSEEFPIEDRPRRMSFDWWQHPYHDDAWFENERRRYRLQPQGFQREVLRNPFTESQVFIYAAAQHKAVDPKVTYNPSWPSMVTMDPGVRDQFQLVACQQDPVRKHIDVLDGYNTTGKPASYIGRLILGQLTDSELALDSEAERIMPLLTAMHERNAHYFGDPEGWQRKGASAESVYGVLARDFEIKVRRDINSSGQFEQARKPAISDRARREALLEALDTMRFADTPGARFVLESIRQNRFRNPEGSQVQTEESAPLHDWTSHAVSAMQFLLVNLRIMQSLADFYAGLEEPTRLQPRNLRRQSGSRNLRALARASR